MAYFLTGKTGKNKRGALITPKGKVIKFRSKRDAQKAVEDNRGNNPRIAQWKRESATKLAKKHKWTFY